MGYKKMASLCLVCIGLLAAGCTNKSTDALVNETEMVNESSAYETESTGLVSEGIDEQMEQEYSDATVESELPVNSDLPAVSNPNGIEYEVLPDDIKGMLIPIDSLLLYNVEMGGEYNPDDPEMFWLAMYYSIGNFGEFYNRAELRESELVVESMDAAEFATSFVPEFNDFPQIPDWIGSIIRYDNVEDAYFFGVGDRGLSGTEILSYEYVDSNTLKIKARLFAADDNSTIREGEFTLVRNDYASGVIEPLFYFSVSEAEFSEE